MLIHKLASSPPQRARLSEEKCKRSRIFDNEPPRAKGLNDGYLDILTFFFSKSHALEEDRQY